MPGRQSARKRVASPAETTPSVTWREWVGLGWLLAFVTVFFLIEQANNRGVERLSILENAPAQIADMLLPVPKEQQDVVGWKFFPQRWSLLGIACLIWAGAWGTGSLLMRLLSLTPTLSRLERLTFALGLGIAAQSLLTLVFGLAGWLFRGLMLLALLLPLAAEIAIGFFIARRREPGERRTADESLSPWLKRTFLVLCVLFAFAMLLGSMLPPWDFDVKAYHMAGPKEWHLNGEITFLPHNVYTTFPFLTEMVSLQAMTIQEDWFRGAMAGKAALSIFSVLTALGLFCMGKRFCNSAAGCVAAIVWLTTPWAHRIAVIAYAEGGLSCYTLLAAFALLIYWQQSDQKSAGLFALLTGLFAGCAMACKYPAALTTVLPIGLLICSRATRINPQSAIRNLIATGLLYTLGVLITVGPWLMRNLIWTGNPVYPLAWSIFGGVDWNAGMEARWQEGHSPDGHTLGMLWESLTLFVVRNDWLSPLLFALAPLSILLHRRSTPVLLAALLTTWFLAIWWVFTHRIDRFFVPMLPVIAFLAGAGAARLIAVGGLLKVVPLTALALTAAYAMSFNVTTQVSGFTAWLVDQDRAEKIARSAELSALHSALRGKQNVRVLAVGEAKYFDALVPMLYNSVFDRSLFVEFFEGKSLAESREIFRKKGITHIFVNWQELIRYRTTYGYSGFVTAEKFNELREAGFLGEPLFEFEREWSKLSKTDRDEIERWTPALRNKRPTGDTITTLQLFPVNLEPNGGG